MPGQPRPMIFAPLPVAAAVSIWDSRRKRPTLDRLRQDIAVNSASGLPPLVGNRRELEVGYCNRATIIRRLLAQRDEWFPKSEVTRSGQAEAVAVFTEHLLAPIARLTRARWWCDMTDDQIVRLYVQVAAAMNDYANALLEVISESGQPHVATPRARPGLGQRRPPMDWDDLIGQDFLKAELQSLIEQAEEDPLPNVLITSSSHGDGKMAVASAFICETERPWHWIAAHSSTHDVAIILRDVRPYDVVLLVDVDRWYGQERPDLTGWAEALLRMQDITLVATATIAELPAELISRFHRQLTLAPYNQEEFEQLVLTYTGQLFLPSEMPPFDQIVEIAARARRPSEIRAEIEKLAARIYAAQGYSLDATLAQWA